VTAGDGERRDSFAPPRRRTLALPCRSAHHARNLELAGSRVDQPSLARAVAAEDWPAAEALVSDDVVSRHTATGTTAEVSARLAEYVAAGLDEVALAGLRDPADTGRVLGAVLTPISEETR
jgi:5,10-methylenetetrahydromethanopterin reductase